MQDISPESAYAQETTIRDIFHPPAVAPTIDMDTLEDILSQPMFQSETELLKPSPVKTPLRSQRKARPTPRTVAVTPLKTTPQLWRHATTTGTPCTIAAATPVKTTPQLQRHATPTGTPRTTKTPTTPRTQKTPRTPTMPRTNTMPITPTTTPRTRESQVITLISKTTMSTSKIYNQSYYETPSPNLMKDATDNTTLTSSTESLLEALQEQGKQGQVNSKSVSRRPNTQQHIGNALAQQVNILN